MDSYLAGVEPQMTIPVIVVVVLAVLTYMFGFQKTQEPSLQHLAVLNSAGKTNKSAAAAKQKNQLQNGVAGQKGGPGKGKDKGLSNGHLIQGKEKAVKQEKSGSNKENVKPTQQVMPTPKSKKDKSGNENQHEEIDGGEWIPAVSRKDKKSRPKKEELPAEPVTPRTKKANLSKNESPKKILAGKPEAVEEVKVIPASPAAKDKKKGAPVMVVAPVVTTSESKPETTPEPTETVEKKIEELANETSEKERKVADTVFVEQKRDDAKSSGKHEDDTKNNVAFDEMGELWEEAKSRGAKKKRARKD